MKKLLCFLLGAYFILSSFGFSVSADEEFTVIAFGDSITAADKWQKHIEKAYGIDIINGGVGGDTTNSAKTRFQRDVIAKKPHIVFISLGVNDCAIDMARYVDIDTYKANMAYFIDECQKIGARVIVNIPTPVVDELYLTRHEAEPFLPYGRPNGIVALYAQAAREVSQEKGVPFADLYSRFSAMSGYKKYFPDGVHLSDTGYKLYAEIAMEAYQSLFIGDVNFDLAVNQYDYILLKRYCMDMARLTDKQLLSADVNGDGSADAFDYIFIKRSINQ